MADIFELSFEFKNKRYTDAQAGLAAFAKALGNSVERAGPVLSKELRDWLDTVAEALAKRHGSPWPGGTTENTLSKRSGALVQSIKDSVEVTGTKLDDIQGRLGSALPYAKIHETGGTITAKKSKYLTIPLPAALGPNGVPKKKSAKEWDNTFIATSKKGNLIIFQKQGGRVVPLYLLRTSVKIPPRLGLRDTLEAGLPFFVDKALDAMLREVRNG
jgi:hypothetical protein